MFKRFSIFICFFLSDLCSTPTPSIERAFCGVRVYPVLKYIEIEQLDMSESLYIIVYVRMYICIFMFKNEKF